MMDIEVTVRAHSPEDLQEKLKRLITDTDGTGLLDYDVRRAVRLSRRDLDAILDEYCEVCCRGDYSARQDLIQKHANETTLYDAPIDTWWAIADDAHQRIRAKEREDAVTSLFEELAK